MRIVLSLLAMVASVVGSSAAVADEGEFSTFGDATVVRGDRPRDRFLVLNSDIESDVPYAGVSWEPETRRRNPTFLLLELNRLSVDYLVYQGGVGLGSPRFSIGIDEDYDGEVDGNIFVYLGDPPDFMEETSFDFQSSGNLLAGNDLRVDSTQFGGPFYGTFDDALDVAGFGDVLYVDFVVDAGYAFEDGMQTIVVQDLRINRDRLNLRQLQRSEGFALQ